MLSYIALRYGTNHGHSAEGVFSGQLQVALPEGMCSKGQKEGLGTRGLILWVEAKNHK